MSVGGYAGTMQSPKTTPPKRTFRNCRVDIVILNENGLKGEPKNRTVKASLSAFIGGGQLSVLGIFPDRVGMNFRCQRFVKLSSIMRSFGRPFHNDARNRTKRCEAANCCLASLRTAPSQPCRRG